MSRCPRCGHEAHAGTKFCPECGAALAASTPAAPQRAIGTGMLSMRANRQHRHPESDPCRDGVGAAAIMRAGEPLARA